MGILLAVAGCGAAVVTVLAVGLIPTSETAVAAPQPLCIPSIVSADELQRLSGGGGTSTPVSLRTTLNDLLKSGRLVVINQAIIDLPEIKQLIADQVANCSKKAPP